MEPPSPSKYPMSPGMPVFPVSPERAAGTKPPYGAPPAQSPSLPDLRMSPLRRHRRNDSDVSVQGLAAMFENLEVKDFKEAQAKYLAALQKQRAKHEHEISQLERKHELDMSRREVRIDELKNDLERIKQGTKDAIPRDIWDAARQEQREAIAKWEKALAGSEERRHQAEKKILEVSKINETLKVKYLDHKKHHQELYREKVNNGSIVPRLQSKLNKLDETVQRLDSDNKFLAGQAKKYKELNQSLELKAETIRAHSEEEIQTLRDRLKLIEGERDALKTSLREEEIMRIAAEGQIPLPAATLEEHDEFGSPARSPRKQRTPERDDEDKENVAPKKAVMELMIAQRELATEKCLRERAQEQVDFMKMECQFRCCSCRIADSKGSHYVHDDTYTTEIERIKASVPAMTPPPSNHGDEPTEGVVIKQEPVDDESPLAAPAEELPRAEQNSETADKTLDTTTMRHSVSKSPEPPVLFSPTTGTFRAVPSPVQAPVSTHASTPAQPSRMGLSAITEMTTESSPWTPDANSTVIPASRPQSRADEVVTSQAKIKSTSIVIHEDAVTDSDEEDLEPQTPLHGPSGPATPGQYLTRTITTTTTIPLHFSPATPAMKQGNQPLTPSTVAHAPFDAQTPVLGELSLNKLPFDREAALEAIRQRRGRARSMAAGHGTPRKQMMEGVKERRDISAPVSRVRR